MSNEIVIAIVIIAFMLPIATFLLGYYFAHAKLHAAMIKSRVKLVELEIKIKDAKLKKLNEEINHISDFNDNQKIHVLDISPEDENDLNTLLNALSNLDKKNQDKK